MTWPIDQNDPRPPYDQLRVQIIEDIRAGRLLVGARLPTVRELAASAGVAVNTAARAYRELESGGFLETRGRAGTFVRGEPGASESAAAEETARYLQRMRALGYDADAVVALIRALRG